MRAVSWQMYDETRGGEPGRRTYVKGHDGIEFEVVSYS
jgi:hypothetical protein